MFEGEEEIGSPSLDGVHSRPHHLLAADGSLGDGANVAHRRAVLTVASRGLGGLEITLTARPKDLHSGRHGGAVANR